MTVSNSFGLFGIYADGFLLTKNIFKARTVAF